MGRTTVVYDKWDAGEFGTKNPVKAPNGSWTGSNVVVYDDGMIGPRPGVRRLNISTFSKFGPLLGLGFSPVGQTDNRPVFFICEDRVYAFDPQVLDTEAATNDLAQAPDNTDPERVLSKESVRLIGDEVYFTINDDQTYRLDCRQDPPVLTAISSSQQGTDIELYRDRMLVANGSNRVFYSDAASFDSWPAGNFFDVGAAYRIISMLTFRDTLVIFTQSGVWLLTGTPDDGTLRRVSDVLAPLDKAPVVSVDGIYYIPSSRSAPVVFNGSIGDEKSLGHLEDWKSSSASAYGVQSYGNRDIIFCSSTGKLLWRKNDAWSVHTLRSALNIGPWVTRYFDDHVVLADPATASTKPKFYMLAMNLNRPAFTSDTWSRPGDDTDTPLSAEFTLPDYVAETGKELRVRAVTVDFFAYNTGATGTNNISMDVTSFGTENNDGTQTHTAAGVFSEAVTDGTTSGKRTRRIYRGTPLGYSSGYRLRFYDLRGVKIERVTVEYDEHDAPVA